MDKGLQTIGIVRRRWQQTALQPYLWLGSALSLLAGLGVYLLNWPLWLLPAWLGIIALGLLLDRNWRPSQAQLCRHLDQQFPQLQDSSSLLWQRETDLSPVQQLQRKRIDKTLQRLRQDPEKISLGPAHLRSPVTHAFGVCLGLWLFVVGSPFSVTDKTGVAQQSAAIATTEKLAIVGAETRIQPPSYTGLAASRQGLLVDVPEQTQVQWSIEFNTPVDGLEMLAESENFIFSPQGEVPSKEWQLQRRITKADFYQLSVQVSDTQELLPEIHNIQVQKDSAPEFVFEAPSLRIDTTYGHSKTIPVKVVISDDYQVSSADLLVTLASGNGENLRFREERIALASLQPSPLINSNNVHYNFSLPLDQFSMEAGDELYWYLEARDNREPSANISKSQHFILRWPQDEIFGLSDSVGMAIKVLPEYFRSQRQLIIDTEALLIEREKLPPEEFRKRSEGLAYEQNLLRMRYGRFLGEEDSEAEHADSTAAQHADEENAEHSENHQPPEQDEHQAHSEKSASPFAQRDSHFEQTERIAASAGHLHDSSEHATLFDPQTKELLRNALNAMWSSHRDLSVIEPLTSLPHQHRALRFIKEVQQASRIYLQRVGFEAPLLDESRRLSGEREAVAPQTVSSEFEQPERVQLLALMEQLHTGADLDIDFQEQISKIATTQAADIRLELSKQLRLYQQQPSCTECRQSLNRLLYQLLPIPKAAPSLPLQAEQKSNFSRWLHQ
ncbi:hypothetical protein MO867_01565 [Microbulbifer sp. OS29]|uniref:DUF4175 domain-containing protein n=1 Tax=Microbulbifer okhotskensis TaxID=2926617 RepID=A0A9X2EIT5_9GAMM|nr:hypothetical protein [Microbulbifer okhotskensis]MCO1333017.1 hypothetical protein [Microbulbifer okhotskensis]